MIYGVKYLLSPLFLMLFIFNQTFGQENFKVLKVKGDLAVVNIGSKDGLVNGQELYVKRFDGRKYYDIAIVVAVKVLQDRAAIKIILKEGKEELKKGDLVLKAENVSTFDKLFKTESTPAVINIGTEKVYIHYGDNIIYILKSPIYRKRRFGSTLKTQFHGEEAIENIYIKINNETKTINYKSSNEKILKIDEKGRFEVKKAVDIIVTVSIDNNYATIPFKIIEIPIKHEMKREEVIKILGMPDKRTKKYIGWLESDTIDGIYYYADTYYGGGLSIDHWIYNKYPKAVLRFSSMGYLKHCTTAKWANLFLMNFTK